MRAVVPAFLLALGVFSLCACDRSEIAGGGEPRFTSVAPRILTRTGANAGEVDSVLITVVVDNVVRDTTYPYGLHRGSIGHVPVGATYAVSVTGFNSVDAAPTPTQAVVQSRLNLWTGSDSGTAKAIVDSAVVAADAPVVVVDTAAPLKLGLDTVVRRFSGTQDTVTVPTAGISPTTILRWALDAPPTWDLAAPVPADGRIPVSRTCRVVVRTFRSIAGIWVGSGTPETLSVHVTPPSAVLLSSAVDSAARNATLDWVAATGAHYLLYATTDSVPDSVLFRHPYGSTTASSATFPGLARSVRYTFGLRAAWGPDSLLSDTGAAARVVLTVPGILLDTATALAGLSVDSGMLSPPFDPSRIAYGDTISASLGRIAIVPKTASTLDTIKVEGVVVRSGSTDTLAVVRDTSYTLTVSSPNTGTVRSYSLAVVHRHSPTAHDTAFAVAENSQPGTAVGTLRASGDTTGLRWTVVGGDSLGAFATDGPRIVVNGALNFRSQSKYVLAVQLRNAWDLSDTAHVSIAVVAVNRPPAILTPPETLGVAENAAVGTALDTLQAVDPDGDALNWSIVSGDSGAAFGIDSKGILRVSGSLDYAMRQSYPLQIQVTDGLLKDTVAILVNVSFVTCKEKFDSTQYFCDHRDGQRYRYVTLGSQTWMAQNLDFAGNSTGSSWCYNDSATYCATYGRLYDWAGAMALASSLNSNMWNGDTALHRQGVCPSGWHVPTATEWDTLDTWVDLSNDSAINDDAGSDLASTNLWSANTGTNRYGFSALPAGEWNADNSTSQNLGGGAYFVSASETNTYGWYNMSSWTITSGNASFGPNENAPRRYGMSLRCVKD